MQAIVALEPGKIEWTSVADPEPGPGDVVVELKTAALNRRDLRVTAENSRWSFPLPFIPGSDGAGVRADTGEEVVICPSLGWGDDERAPADGWRILGGPDNGTFAELVAVPKENVFPRPPRLSWEESAALPLAGLTAYRALFTVGKLQPGETVLVIGAGSGVSTFAVALAAQAGANVIVTSSSDEKLDRARSLGATHGVNYRAPDWVEQVRALAGGADLAIDSVGVTWMDCLRCLRPGGRLVAFGSNGGSQLDVDVRFVFLNWLSILGTTMGSTSDFQRLLELVNQATWRPAVDSVRPLADLQAAIARMEEQSHFGKLVLAIS